LHGNVLLVNVYQGHGSIQPFAGVSRAANEVQTTIHSVSEQNGLS
jgi:hypothetical protein